MPHASHRLREKRPCQAKRPFTKGLAVILPPTGPLRIGDSLHLFPRRLFSPLRRPLTSRSRFRSLRFGGLLIAPRSFAVAPHKFPGAFTRQGPFPLQNRA